MHHFEAIALLVIIALVIYIYYAKPYSTYNTNPTVEGYNDENGRFCLDCHDKNLSSCLSCFNCGWCQNADGTGKCIGATIAAGAANNERCGRLMMGDPWAAMIERNRNYKCSYGPDQANRVIGIPSF